MAPRRPVLVTGGAGYIGSHVIRVLRDAGHPVVVYDDLSTGHRWAALGADLIVGNLAEHARLAALFAEREFGAVLHLAALIWVEESRVEPARYYRNNVGNALGLFDLAARHGVGSFVFSSTAAVYGEPDVMPIAETAPLAPINPYGASKMMAERILQDIAAASGLRYVILRYFNVAGADPQRRIGQATPAASHLIKAACESALGRRPGMRIHGTDYPTPDGTCVRDYIHVERPPAVRQADPGLFEHAPRYHGGGFAGAGQLPDEVPIIARRGELVVPPERVVREEKTAREQRPITVVIKVTAADASSFRASQIAADMARAIDHASRNR